MDALGTNIQNQILRKHCLAQTDVVAAGSGDAAEIVGTTLLLSGLASRPRSVDFLIPVEATLAEGETIGVVADVEYSTDSGSTWASLVASATLLTLTGDAYGTVQKGVAHVGSRLDKKDLNAVRVNVTPDCSASGTDTAKVGAGVAIFGGLDAMPQADAQDT